VRAIGAPAVWARSRRHGFFMSWERNLGSSPNKDPSSLVGNAERGLESGCVGLLERHFSELQAAQPRKGKGTCVFACPRDGLAKVPS
jgi:hypothetical protein